jgi:hypothetical protein
MHSQCHAAPCSGCWSCPSGEGPGGGGGVSPPVAPPVVVADSGATLRQVEP